MEENILLPFPSDYDEKLKVSSLDPNTEVMVVQSNPNLDINYFDAREMIARLPRILPDSETPEGVGEVRVSNRSKRKLISEIGNYESELKTAYLNAVPYILEVIQKSLLLEEHRDRMKNTEGNRVFSNEEDPNIDRVQRLYGAINLRGLMYRLKTTLQVFRDDKATGKYHGFEITKIELLSPKLRNIAKPAIAVALNNSSIDELLSPIPGVMEESPSGNRVLNNSSISLAKLLKGVELSYEPNVKLLDAMQACHQFALTGDYTELVKVYETGRNKRLSTTLSDPLQSVKQAQAEMVSSTKQATRIVVPSSPVQEQAEAILDARQGQGAPALKTKQEVQSDIKSHRHKL